MWVNPLTYSISLLNHTLGLPNAYPGAVESLVVTAAFGLVLLLLRACWRRRRRHAARHERAERPLPSRSRLRTTRLAEP